LVSAPSRARTPATRRSPCRTTSRTGTARQASCAARPCRWLSTATRSPRSSSTTAANPPRTSPPRPPGYEADLPGSENLEYNPEKAKELWAEAEKLEPYDASEPLTIGYNADKGDHKTWVEALVNSVKNTLGIEITGKPYATFKEARTEATEQTLTGAIRSGWQADYPSLYNFLGPIYATGAGSNDAVYTNAEFDKALKDGLAADSVEEGNEAMNKAQETLLEDLPAIPLWYQVAQGGWSNNVDNVEFGWNGVPLYHAITGK
jgi:oligopeptide transport system substrate-binding protein